MSILSLCKVTLVGRTADREQVLEELQALGCLHLISLNPPSRRPETTPSGHAEEAREALRWLRDCPRQRRQLPTGSHFDFNTVVAETLDYKQRTRDAGDRRDFLEKRIRDLEPWGDFYLPPLAELGGQRLWFYVLPVNKLKALQRLELPWQIVARDTRRAYVVVIAPEEPPASTLPVARIHSGDRSLTQLRADLDEVEIELDHLVGRREAYTRYIDLLNQNLNRAEDTAARHQARYRTWESQDGLFAVQAWVPHQRLTAVQHYADHHHLATMAEEPSAEDSPPTLLDNPAELAGGEDLLTFYQTPGYRAWDPSLVVFASFALFFAMILSDAGYALVLSALLGYYWRAMAASPGLQRFRWVAVAALGLSLLYGIIAGSYFGVVPPPDSLAGRLRFLDLDNFDVMMRLSILIGCLHVGLANGIMAYRLRPFPHNAQPLGWIAVIIGGYLMYVAPWWLGAPLVAAGLVLIVSFASQRPLDGWKNSSLRILESLVPLANISKLFGDVLSYLRLFALGLASASLAITFNDLALQVRDALPGLGLLLALLILLIGHAINLGLGIISGFVHGLRLNFIEFLNWGMTDEGYPFEAFAKKEKRP